MKTNRYKTASSLIVLSACITASSLSAQTYFADNFDSYSGAPKVLPFADGTGNWRSADNTNGRAATVKIDSSNLFGQGTSNQYLSMTNVGYSSSPTLYNGQNGGVNRLVHNFFV